MAIAARVLAVLILLSVSVLATERELRTELRFLRKIPEAREGESPKPLFVYVTTDDRTRDQERFDEVALRNETFLLATKFFDAVSMRESEAAKHPLFDGLEFTAPAVVVFDSTRKNRTVAGGRASAMKVYQTLIAVGQRDWKTNIAATVRAARNHLATYDQIDAARDALSVKRDRIGEAEADGNAKKAAQLRRQVDEEQAEIERSAEKANARWAEIWDLQRVEREEDE